MEQHTALHRLRSLGLLAVVRAASPELAYLSAQALIQGGVQGIEITFTIPDAPQVVKRLSADYGDQILLGMGTLTHPEQVQFARQAGAQFLVSPITDPRLVKAMLDSALLSIPGALTPSEVFNAQQLGAKLIKIFPATLVGPAYIKTLQTLFPGIDLLPTGGVNPGNLAEWFAAGALAVAAGSELCPPALARQAQFSAITRRAAEFVQAVQDARSQALGSQQGGTP